MLKNQCFCDNQAGNRINENIIGLVQSQAELGNLPLQSKWDHRVGYFSTLIISPGTQPISISVLETRHSFRRSVFWRGLQFLTQKSFHCRNKSSFVASIGFTIFGNGMNKEVPVQFHFLSSCTLQNRRALKAFVLSIFKKERKSLRN